jgi:DNA repair photolyase
MPLIYQPKGAAGEYAELALNYYKGCGHGCLYCYAPGILRTDRRAFREDVTLKTCFMDGLKREAAKLAGDERPIHLSFTSDIYQPAEKTLQATRGVLNLFCEYRLTPQVLTKAGTWAIERDADLLARAGASWGATLTLDDADASRRWESGAALPADRIQALKLAKAAGLQTWVSLEPVLDPEAVFRLIDRTAPFVDLFKVGKLNRHEHAGRINWPRFRADVTKRLTAAGAAFTIKADLANAR